MVAAARCRAQRNEAISTAAGRFDSSERVWSDQYDVKIQLVGRPAPGDQLVVVEGRPDDHRFVALYSCSGRLTGGLSFNRRAATTRVRALLATRASLKCAVASFAASDTAI